MSCDDTKLTMTQFQQQSLAEQKQVVLLFFSSPLFCTFSGPQKEREVAVYKKKSYFFVFCFLLLPQGPA